MKYKYVVFCPYFGKLPVNFNFWLNSCSFNKDFKFIIFTDNCIRLKIPSNVCIISISFDKFRKKIQDKFDFKISLETPYKLCDYKVTYGYVFSEYLDDCLYWGACDMDLIFGDLSKFMPTKLYDKISHKGHFMLMKNDSVINKAFMNTTSSKVNYIDILSSNIHFASDEIGDYGINNILIKNGFSIFDYEKFVADISPIRRNMRLFLENKKIDVNKKVFVFDNGKVFINYLDKDLIKSKEYAYIHFQKRKMILNNNVNNPNRFIITYCSFENYLNITKQYILKHQPIFNLDFKIFKLRCKNLIKKIKRKIMIIKIVNKG